MRVWKPIIQGATKNMERVSYVMSVGSKRQLCAKPKNTKHSRTIIFSPKSIVHIYFAYSYVLTYGYVFKIRMVIWVEKQPSRGSSNFHDLGFPSTFIAALARSHAAKQRFTSSDCEFLKLMRFSSRNLRDFVPSLLDEILYAELFRGMSCLCQL